MPSSLYSTHFLFYNYYFNFGYNIGFDTLTQITQSKLQQMLSSIDYKFQFITGQSQQILNQGFNTWLDIIKLVSPAFLKHHKQKSNVSQLNTKVYVIQVKGTQIDRDSLEQSTMTWRIIKDVNDFMDFDRKVNNKNKLNLPQLPFNASLGQKNTKSGQRLMLTGGDQVNAFVHYLNVFAEKKQAKNNLYFLQFINHCVNKSKWNLHVYGHYFVQKAQEVGFVTKCLPCFAQDQSELKSLYLTVTSEGLIYSQENLKEGKVQQMITFCPKMKIGYVLSFEASQNVLGIELHYRKLTLHFQNFEALMKFCTIFHLALLKSGYRQKNLHNSFAPLRKHNNCSVFIHGQDYFANMCDDLRKAKKVVCITGWIISAHFLLKRPGTISDSPDRLDRVLGQIAQRGVHIFMLIYKEPSAFADNDSQYAQEHLQKQSKNITILRHPSPIIPKLWSHHQKMVLIDEQIAYVGGFDLSYSRWDNSQHSISDIPILWDGIDYNNNRLVGIENPQKYKEDIIDRVMQPRMPWHDVGAKLVGPTAIDFKRHFVQYWNFAMHQLKQSSEVFEQNLQARVKKLSKRSKIAIESALVSKMAPQATGDCILLDQQFSNNKQTVVDSQEQQIDELQYYNVWLNENKKCYAKLKKNKDQCKNKLVSSRPTQIYVEGTFDYGKKGNTQVQLLRSASAWTIGMVRSRQHSIHQAYYRMILQSKFFVYIQNQFFMGQEHLIFQALIERIIRANKQGKQFKVIVVLPLCPDQPTNILNIQKSPILGKLLHEQYKSIKQIIHRLKQAGINNTDDYIFFFGLRNHGLLGKDKDIPQTELIYVHSKVLVVDDDKMIVGSANVNDRSMLGNRDSELAILIESKDQSNDQVWNYRKKTWKQHFGLNQQESQDIYRCWDKMIKNARKNTKIYRELFGCYPDNQMSRLKDVKQLKQKSNAARYDQLKKDIVGFAVEFPFLFLRQEDLDFKPLHKQKLMPNIMWI